MFNRASAITRSMTALPIILATLTTLAPNPSWAQILNRHTGLPIPGLESFTPAPDANFAGLDLTDADLREFNLSGAANFENAIIRGVAFGCAPDFSLAQLVSTASYQIHDLRDVSIRCADMANANFQSQNLENARFRGTNLAQANFTNANLTRAEFDESNLAQVNFTNANLTGVYVYESSFAQPDFTNANLSYMWFDFDEVPADLADAVFTGATIQGARFSGVENFTEAQLQSTANYQAKSLSGIAIFDVSGWDLRDQKLNGARFWLVDGTDFRGADLSNAYLIDGASVANAVFDASTIYNQHTVRLSFDPEAAGLTFQATPLGDFDGDRHVDASDLRELEEAIRGGGRFGIYGVDVNGDGSINVADAEMWVDEIKRTWRGDANLDGVFDSTDLVQVFESGEYEDSLIANSTWATGDWNFDGEFSTDDLIVAFQGGGYEQGPRANVAAVPEPSTWLLGLLTLPAILRRRG